MSVLIQGYQLREIAFGVQVTKAAQTLPQTTTSTLFTVAGGAVLVTSLLGVVQGAAIQSTDPVLTIGTAPTTGTLEVAGIATSTSLASAEIGTWLTVAPSSGLPGALVVMGTPGKGGNAVYLGAPFVVSAGTITWSTGASKTGKIAWYLSYVPLDNGGSVS